MFGGGSEWTIYLCLYHNLTLTLCFFQTFLEFMNGKAPDTILTDQNKWLKEALAIHMLRTKHAFCIWHIVAKFSDWFSLLLGSQYDKWKADFHRVYNMQTVEEFDSGWKEMCNMYGLHGNEHIIGLYSLRSFWALPYLRSYFFAGMANPSYSESVNGYIRRVLSAHSALDNFVEQVISVPLKVTRLLTRTSNVFKKVKNNPQTPNSVSV